MFVRPKKCFACMMWCSKLPQLFDDKCFGHKHREGTLLWYLPFTTFVAFSYSKSSPCLIRLTFVSFYRNIISIRTHMGKEKSKINKLITFKACFYYTYYKVANKKYFLFYLWGFCLRFFMYAKCMAKMSFAGSQSRREWILSAKTHSTY